MAQAWTERGGLIYGKSWFTRRCLSHDDRNKQDIVWPICGVWGTQLKRWTKSDGTKMIGKKELHAGDDGGGGAETKSADPLAVELEA